MPKNPFVVILGVITMTFVIFSVWQWIQTDRFSNESFTLVPLPPDKSILDTMYPQRSAAADETAPSSVIITPSATTASPAPLRKYIEITTGCNLAINETCVRAYSRPTASSTERYKLRVGSVLLIKTSTTTDDGSTWYEIDFDEPLRYGERVTMPWYVSASAGTVIDNIGVRDWSTSTPTTTKYLVVNKGTQKLHAYDGETLVKTYTISTGLDLTPTPYGTFRVYKMTPTRYMQGPIPGISTKYYDLPGVPWNLYFTKEGAIVHGAYWHNNFGQQHSNGCVNVNPAEAREIYDWADLGMMVFVRP